MNLTSYEAHAQLIPSLVDLVLVRVKVNFSRVVFVDFVLVPVLLLYNAIPDMKRYEKLNKISNIFQILIQIKIQDKT